VRVKLLDFGIAKLARNEVRMERTATGTIVGTPMYISPEQARGHEIDSRADIYSLGAIAFEMIAGRTLFLAESAMEMVAKHLLEAPRGLGDVVRDVPPALERVVTGMIQKDPKVRPGLAELIAALDGARATESSSPSHVALRVGSAPALPAPALTATSVP